MKLPRSLSDKDEKIRRFTPEEEELKKLYYEKMAPRRRRFIDRIGFDKWDPFEGPKEPMDIRVDTTGRTIEDLVEDFNKSPYAEASEGEFQRGVMNMAYGLVNKDEMYRGAFAFALWYAKVLKKE